MSSSDTRPIVFLHIPKTAGTSFLLMLQNVFGDNRVLRLAQIDEHTRTAVQAYAKDEIGTFACLTGHLPMYLFDGELEQFRIFTVLRNPIARVLSLYRFYKQRRAIEAERLQLSGNFSLEEFLDSQIPELYGQINNGMVRMLCGDVRLYDAESAQLYDEEALVAVLPRALANLERIDFGLTESMEQVLRLVQNRWAIPYSLREYRENLTGSDRSEADSGAIHQIALRNSLDLTLHYQGKILFDHRLRSLPQPPTTQDTSHPSVFKPTPNQRVSVANIAGRQGFFEFEPKLGLAWLCEGLPAAIHFSAPVATAQMRLHFFCVMPDYPVQDVIVCVNGHIVAHQISFAVDGQWCWLETDFFGPLAGINELSIEVPLFIEAAALLPGSPDKRRLGLALADAELRV